LNNMNVKTPDIQGTVGQLTAVSLKIDCQIISQIVSELIWVLGYLGCGAAAWCYEVSSSVQVESLSL
ncbi:MAG: hypothetical protein EZS28_043832, partial [Streblomastix strix]